MSEEPCYKGGPGWGAKILSVLAEDIKVTNLGGGFYQLDFPRIAQIGAAVTTNHTVNFSHLLVGIYVKHTDATKDDATTQLTFSSKFMLRENLMFAQAAFVSTEADEAFTFNDVEGARNATHYEFVTDTTNLHWVYISMIIRATGVI